MVCQNQTGPPQPLSLRLHVYTHSSMCVCVCVSISAHITLVEQTKRRIVNEDDYSWGAGGLNHWLHEPNYTQLSHKGHKSMPAVDPQQQNQYSCVSMAIMRIWLKAGILNQPQIGSSSGGCEAHVKSDWWWKNKKPSSAVFLMSDSNESRHFIVTHAAIIKRVFLLPSREKGSGYY